MFEATKTKVKGKISDKPIIDEIRDKASDHFS